MAPDNETEEEKNTEPSPEIQATSGGGSPASEPQDEITHSLGQLELYFQNGRKLLTVPGGTLNINDDTRRLLALFSDGSFLVSEAHKFDGRVLSFEVLARKKKLMIVLILNIRLEMLIPFLNV